MSLNIENASEQQSTHEVLVPVLLPCGGACMVSDAPGQFLGSWDSLCESPDCLGI
jgi:hypothetical protein